MKEIMKYHKNEKATINYLILAKQLKLNDIQKKLFKEKQRKYIIMKIISQKKNLGVMYMPRLPKNLITPNPKTAYGRTKIRRLLKLKGGTKERNIVLNEARSQGYEGNRLDSAYKHLAFALDMILSRERDEFRQRQRRDEQIITVSFTLVGKGYFRQKNGQLRLAKTEDKLIPPTKVKRKDINKLVADEKKEHGEAVGAQSPFDIVEVDVVGGVNTIQSSGNTSLSSTPIFDYSSLNIDNYLPNELWDTKRNKCVVDFIKYRYKNQKGLKKMLKLNKKATVEESDNAIQYYATHQQNINGVWVKGYGDDVVDLEMDMKPQYNHPNYYGEPLAPNTYDAIQTEKKYGVITTQRYKRYEYCIEQNPNKNGYTIEHIKLLSKNLNVNMVAIVDGLIHQSVCFKDSNKRPSIVFEMKNNHLYPIVEVGKVKSWCDKAKNINSVFTQVGVEKAVVKKDMDIVYKQHFNNTTKVQYALEVMIKNNCYAPFIELNNDQLSNFKLGDKSFILDYENDLVVKDIRRYCNENDGYTYEGQPAQSFTYDYLKEFKVKSYFNPQVRNVLLSDKLIKHRVHYGATSDPYDGSWIDKYKEAKVYDFNKHYRWVMENPLEKLLIIPFYSEIRYFKQGDDIRLGLYYIRTDDMTLLHQSNWYSSAMVLYALSECIIELRDIKYCILGFTAETAYKKLNQSGGEQVEPIMIDDIINKMATDLYDPTNQYENSLMKNAINSVYGMLAKTDKTTTRLRIDECPNNMFEKYVGKRGLANKGTVIQKYKSQSNLNIGVRQLWNNKHLPDEIFKHINSYLPSNEKSRIIYTYGDRHYTQYLSNNLPIAIQILDQSNIKLHKLIKKSKGECVWRKTDAVAIYGGIDLVCNHVIGGLRDETFKKPNIEDINPMNTNRHIQYTHYKPKWRDLQYSGSNEWLSIIGDMVDNGGGLLLGRAGTGKSYVSIKGMECLLLCGLKSQALAFTNKATIQLSGRTIHNFLKIDKDGKVNREWARKIAKQLSVIFIDEISMISADLWALLCELKIESGVKFILIGDYRQLPPVGDGANINWFNHSVVHYLANGNRCELTERQRYDLMLWNRLEDLWENNDFSMLENVEDWTIDDLLASTNICYRNKTVKHINHLCMEKVRPSSARFVKYNIPKDINGNQMNEPAKYHQDAYVYAGMPLIMFITTKEKNAEEHKKFMKNEAVRCIEVSDTTFTITNDKDVETYDIKDFHKKVVVGYATTIHKSQGDTVEGKVNIFDAEFMLSDWFSKNSGQINIKKALYTALSRAKSFDAIKICNYNCK